MARTDRHLVVDGSNIATEGRSFPSLAQLDEAVRAISAEYDYDSLTVIVDATFAHRIDASESEELEAAMLAGELVSPPAGAIGRGDAFILQIAAKAAAVVFSNDSFQEFHGEHEWLFDPGRLIGGKPIEGVGWVFVERAPVRGPASRRSVREAGDRTSGRRTSKSKAKPNGGTKQRKATTSKRASGPPPKPSRSNPPPAKSAESEKSNEKPAKKQADGPRQKRSVEELNDARSFLKFVSSYSIGDDVEAVVEQFSSHGCYLRAASARCYLPSRAMGDPPPTRARDVVSQGQTVIVRVESLDSDRRGINVALVRVIPDDGQKETDKLGNDSGATRTRHRNSANIPQEPDVVADDTGREGDPTRRATNVATTKTAKKSAARKRPAAKKTTAKKAPAKKNASKSAAGKKAATATSSARVKRATAKKTPAKKTTAKKTTAKKTTAKKAPAKKTATKRAPAKKTTAKKAPAKKNTTKAPAKKATAKKTGTKKATRKTATKRTARKATR